MFNLINVRIVPLEQIKTNTNEFFYNLLFENLEYTLSVDFETLIPLDKFLEFIKDAIENLEHMDEDELSEKDKKLIKKQAKELFNEIKNLPSGVAIGCRND